MRALVYDGQVAELTEVADPRPEPHQVVLRVSAAGLCHSDISVMNRRVAEIGFPLPVVLGHEACGVVAAVGSRVVAVREGDAVAVHGPRGCGHCRTCFAGRENYCPHARAAGIWPIGLGRDGALAEYLLVDDQASLIPLDGLDPVSAAPLTDAGLTPYHAIRSSMSALTPGSTAVVLGIGGLGHLAVQILRAVTAARVVAVDLDRARADLGARLGADVAITINSAAEALRELTRGMGADFVLDCVGAQSTVDLAVRVVRTRGCIALVGTGPGKLVAGVPHLPLGTTIRTTFWGSRSELVDVLKLARRGQLSAITRQVTLDGVLSAYRQLEAGEIEGRAVAVPTH